MEAELENQMEGLEADLGYKGERGYSAYEIAVQNGYEGTEQEWIDHFGLDLSGYLQNNDVINNLTSEYETRPLSAKMGKTLQENIDTLSTNTNTEINNINAIHTYTKEFLNESTNATMKLLLKEKNGIVYVKVESHIPADVSTGMFNKRLDDFPDWAKINSIEYPEYMLTVFDKYGSDSNIDSIRFTLRKDIGSDTPFYMLQVLAFKESLSVAQDFYATGTYIADTIVETANVGEE